VMRRGSLQGSRLGFRAALHGVLTICLSLIASAAPAQQFPERAIRLVVAFQPGGTTDFSARLFADKTGQILGQNVFVENKPGGNGAIAAEFVARSAPDGYNLFFTTLGAMAITPSLPASLSYNP